MTELSAEDLVLERMVRAGTALKDDHGAGVVIMGCAGMARYHARLEARLGLPVIEPARAATALALNALATVRTRQEGGSPP